MTDLLAEKFEDRIRELIRFREWHRTRNAILRPYFAELEVEWRIELRALLRLRSQVKRAQRRAEKEQRAIDNYKWRHDLENAAELGMI